MKPILDVSFTIAQTAVAGTYTNDPRDSGWDAIGYLEIIAELKGPTGGTLDVTIQDSPDGVKWFDYLHFAQLASGAAAIVYAYVPALSNAIATIGTTTDPATPVPVLAAGSARGGHPMSFFRAVAVVGAGASVGFAQKITIIGR